MPMPSSFSPGIDENSNPWLYKGKRLRKFDFPLGGFGTGNVLLQGDGTLQGESFVPITQANVV